MTVTKTKKKRTGASSTAAANGPSGAVAAEIPVPPSDAGHVEESGNGGDPWVEHDPWAQPSNPDQWKPSLDGYLQFCTWWNTAMASESNETSFSTGDSGGRGGKGYGGGVSAEGKGKGKGGRHHRHRDSSDPGQQQHGRQPSGGSHGGGHQRPFRGPQSDPGVRRGGAAVLGGGPPGRGPGDDGDDPEDGEDSVSFPPGPGPKRRGAPGGSEDPHWSDTDGSTARTSEVKAMLQRRWGNQDRPKSSLGSVKLEDFTGERGRYRGWRRVVKAQQQLYRLESTELAMLIYLSCKREARDVLDQLTIDEMVAPGGLDRVWELLDEAYHETSEEYFERVESEFSQYRRVPGQSIASYLSQIKRLRADYQREDPGTVFSDRAWAQRLLMRASLTKRERLDVFFSAGGIYSSKEVEKALRHRCQRIHDEERRMPSTFKRAPVAKSVSSFRTSSTTSTQSSFRSRGPKSSGGHGSHVATVELPEEDENDEEEDLEQDPDAYEAYAAMVEEEGEQLEDEDQEATDDDDGVSPEELKEAWAAGWRAKDKIAEKRKGRSFRSDAGKPVRRGDDPRKKSTTCSSCGALGHWRGDPECPKVKSGEDKLFQPKPKLKHGVHFVSSPLVPSQQQVKPTLVTDDVKVHEINFAFAVGTGALRGAAKAKSAPPQFCTQCGNGVKESDHFCSKCGTSLAVMRMTDQTKRPKGDEVQAVTSSDDEFEKVHDDSKPEKTDKTVPVPTSAVKTAAGYKPKRDDQTRTTYVSPAVAIGLLPHLEKEDRRHLRELLQAEEVLEERFRSQDRGTGSEQLPVPPQKEIEAPGRRLTTLKPPTDELPAAVHKRQLEEFRRALFDERVSRKGKLRPSEGAAMPNDAQRECPHPWNRLRWSANQYGHFARCRACDLKNVLCWNERHGSFVANVGHRDLPVEDARSVPMAHEAFEVQEFLPQHGILAIGDSGCKTAVGGVEWHGRFQEALRQKGMKWSTVKEAETFKFGAGAPIKSTHACIYPVGLHGVNSYLRMSVVEEDASDCPGLVGPADMSRWKVSFNFGAKTISAMGSTQPMTLTTTRHPGLNLLQFGDFCTFEKPEMKKLKEQLRNDPYAFAFVTSIEPGSGSEAESDAGTADLEDGSSSEVEDPEVWELVEDMERFQPSIFREATQEEALLPGDTDGELSGDTATSHEFGVSWQEADSSDDDEVEVVQKEPDVLWCKIGKACTMTKGKRRQLRSRVHGLSDACQVEDRCPRPLPKPDLRPPSRPYKVLEIFTWTLAITMVAVNRGWIGCEPVTLPRWDLRLEQDRSAAFQYLVKEDPDLLVVAWPCTVWSPLQFLGQMTQERYDRLLRRQQEDRETFLNLVHEMVKYQRSRGKAHLGENPWTSRAWKEVPIQAAYEGEAYGRCDMCCYGLKHPGTGRKLKKPTCLAGTPEIVEACAARCKCVERHDYTLGTYKDKTGTHSVAEFAGGYTKAFARKVVSAAEKFLDEWTPECAWTFAAGGGLPEERFMDADEEVPVIEDDDDVIPEITQGELEDGLEAEYEKEAQINAPDRTEDHPEGMKLPQASPELESPQLTREDAEILKQMSDEKVTIHQTVEKMHRRLGHPSSEALVRMLKVGGAPKDVLDYAKEFRCPTCQSVAPPDRPFQQAPRVRPAGFNVEVHVDLKYAKNIKEVTFVALSMICAGTNKHAAVLLKTRKASYVARKFIKHWIAPFGRPSRIVMDQGGEFEREWMLMLEQFGIHSVTTGSHAGWQHALAERHGGLLGVTWHSLVVQYNVESKEDMGVALAAAVEAKNEVMTRRGYSPNMMVFGKNITYPELLGEEDIDPVTLSQNLDVDCEMAKRSKMRQTARATLLRDDVQDKLKRALQRKPTTQERVYVPGELIYFFVPHVSKPRYRKDHGRWRGPAVVIMQESHQRYFCSWRGRCLLLAAPNMRAATSEEAMSKQIVAQEMGQAMESNKKEDAAKDYEDFSGLEGPGVAVPAQTPPALRVRERPQPRARTPRVQNEASRMMGGLKSVRKLLDKSSLLRSKRNLGLVQPPPQRRGPRRMKAILDGSVGHGDLPVEDARSVPMAHDEPQQEGAAEEGIVLSDEEAFWRKDDEAVRISRLEADEWRRNLTEYDRKKIVLEDFPATALKRHRDGEDQQEEALSKRLKSDFYTTVMIAVSAADLPKKKSVASTKMRANEWLSRSEVKVLRRILDLPVVSARLHVAPRKRMQRPPANVIGERGRVSVMLGEQPGLALLVEETKEEVKAHPRKRSPFQWRGLTLFVREGEVPKGPEKVYVQHGESYYEVAWPSEREGLWTDFLHHERLVQDACEVFLLRMKASGKELDPKYFDQKERDAFQESDRAEWSSWLKNEVVKKVPDHEIGKIDKRKVFKIPLRWVRTNKSKEAEAASQLLAKSRLVIPGHADPGLGEYRTDAPTTNPVAVRLLKTLAVTRSWGVKVFDVSTAFLSGNPTSREVYVRAPADGLPSTSTTTSIPPYSLLRVLKSAYGLAEAPRLWYLRAAQLLEECGLVELPFARATFVMAAGGVTQAVCTLHVDDGMLAGDFSSPTFRKLLTAIDARFNIKEWQSLGKEPCDFLGCKVSMEKGVITDCMSAYVMKIQPMPVDRGEQPLSEPQRSLFRRLVMQLRWPAQHVLPERLFVISELAQAITRATMIEARHANKVLLEFKEIAKQGLMRVCYRPLKGEPYLISFFDASLGKSDAKRAQQGQVHFLASSAALTGPDVASIIEFRSSRITRVVKSSLAAEGNALSSAVDEQLFLRLVCSALWYGPMTITSTWKEDLKVGGTAVTDAKALYDHLLKTGHMTAERQTALDILAAKQLVESGAVSISWVPTFRQFADGLTKDMLDELFTRFKKEGLLSLKETPEDAVYEAHRSSLRKAQRERRKARMKKVQ